MFTTIARTIETTGTAMIKEYLDDLGTLAQSVERSPLANICVYVLESGDKHRRKHRW